MGAKRHQSGVKNELDTLVILQNLGIASKRAKHGGGPRQKADILDEPKSFSAKLETSSGWEWVNTTAVPQSIRDQLFGFFDEVADTVVPDRPKYAAMIADEMNERFHEYMSCAFDSVESSELSALLIEHFVKANSGLICAVNNKNRRVMSCFKFEDHPVAKSLNRGWEPKLVDTGANISRSIVLMKNGEERPANLRLTVNFNNGVKGLLGLKKTKTGGTKKSYLTAKIQQTRVNELLVEANSNVYSY
jgi:hypothetical protein